jgi:peptidyl-tRNA hydrolase, PTH1 family
MIECVVGLGNPGSRYEVTRHNAGFWLVDRLVHAYHGSWKAHKKFFADYAAIVVGDRKIHVLKPMVYMNQSGRAVKALLSFYQIKPESMLVVHDDLDHSPGAVRLKQGGGSGGHQGLNDIIAALSGAKQFNRLRIGIGHPGHADLVSGYVLNRPLPLEQVSIDAALDQAFVVIPSILAGNLDEAARVLHQKKNTTKEQPKGESIDGV